MHFVFSSVGLHFYCLELFEILALSDHVFFKLI